MKRFIPFYILLFFAVNSYSQTAPIARIVFQQLEPCCDGPLAAVVINRYGLQLDDSVALTGWWAKNVRVCTVSDEIFSYIERYVKTNMGKSYSLDKFNMRGYFKIHVSMRTKEETLFYSVLLKDEAVIYFNKLKKALAVDTNTLSKSETKMITDAINRIPYVN